MLLNGAAWDSRLWWVMLATGMAAVVVNLGTGYVSRKHVGWVSERQRSRLHLLSYILLTLSMLAFIVRGLGAPH